MDKLLELLRRPIMCIQEGEIQRLILLSLSRHSSMIPFSLSQDAIARTSSTAPKRTMVIPVEGVLTNSESFWGTTYAGIQSALDRAANDSSIERVVLHVDSPGGEVTGLPETAAIVSAVAKEKPVRAMVTGRAASAAYWLVSQASDITLTPSGEVGSVGVRATHMDVSQYLKDMGIKVTEMFAGQFKTEFSPFDAVSDDSKAYMQTLLDGTYKDFIGAVSDGRGARASKDIREANYGNARMIQGPDAKANGMVDALASSMDFYKSLVPADNSMGTQHAEADPLLKEKREQLDNARKF